MHTIKQNNLIRIAAFVVSIVAFGFYAGSTHAATTGDLLATGDGTYKDFKDVPSLGYDYEKVDETVCDVKTTYIKAGKNRIGWRSSVTTDISSIPDGSTIEAITIKPCASRQNKLTGSSTMDVFYRLNGVNSADEGSYYLRDENVKPEELTPYTFYTGSSTIKNSSTTLEVGVVYTYGDRGVRLSRIAAEITYTAPATSTVPNAPNNLNGYASSSATYLWWDDNSDDETHFNVERSINGTDAFTNIGTSPANSPYFTDFFTPSGTSTVVFYRVNAENSTGTSVYSNIAFVY